MSYNLIFTRYQLCTIEYLYSMYGTVNEFMYVGFRYLTLNEKKQCGLSYLLLHKRKRESVVERVISGNLHTLPYRFSLSNPVTCKTSDHGHKLKHCQEEKQQGGSSSAGKASSMTRSNSLLGWPDAKLLSRASSISHMHSQTKCCMSSLSLSLSLLPVHGHPVKRCDEGKNGPQNDSTRRISQEICNSTRAHRAVTITTILQ